MIALPANTRLLPDPEATARAAADHLLEIVASAPSERIAICLSGGSTPKRLYTLLASSDYVGRLPWSRLHFFFGDDRVVPWDDPLSNVRMVREAFGHATPVPAGHLYFIPSDEGADIGSQGYERTLKDFYGSDSLESERPLFDLVLLGLGSDGHTASLFPGKPAVEESEAWVAPVPEAGMEPFVPRISLTLPALASSRSVLFLVNGKGKRDPLARLAAGESLPSARVTSIGEVTWFIDKDAADA